jgi:hypothetical protein
LRDTRHGCASKTHSIPAPTRTSELLQHDNDHRRGRKDRKEKNQSLRALRSLR